MTPATTIEEFLAALYADASTDSFVELRYRHGSGMRRDFFGADRIDDVAAKITVRGAYTDVHLGVIPRRRRGGRRDDLVHAASVVWVDCDTADSAAALGLFSPSPSMTVRSGTDEHLHGYWLLSQPLDLDAIERTNRKLAYAVGGDIACTDAARVMRPPWSRNWKHDPAVAVRVALWAPRSRHVITDVVAGLKDPPSASSRQRAMPRGHGDMAADSLLEVEPGVYVERLTGTPVPAHRKIACPFHHEDRTPSLHVYREPERGWYCFGCGRGGTVYDLGAERWGLSTRGEDFIELRDRLCDVLGVQRSFGHERR